MKAQLFDRQLFVDDRGHFTNIPLTLPKFYFEGKRVYVCDNFQKGTVRGYHYHKHEAKVFICLKGGIKFVLLPEDMMIKIPAEGWEPEMFTLSGTIPTALYVPANYANAWQTLTDDTIMIGVSDVTVEQSIGDDIRLDPTQYHPEYWEVKWR
ncbi:hypothetical protein LCGC14_1135650 [marine sediment metagenome]|uniref:Sugar 3,4-ketoisomerase QdtA cupin domain-containing protein n=1 Tax=marine sediment metagenome TaxID=412755 RepID=A0A0F9Q5H3_9ZZZZ